MGNYQDILDKYLGISFTQSSDGWPRAFANWSISEACGHKIRCTLIWVNLFSFRNPKFDSSSAMAEFQASLTLILIGSMGTLEAGWNFRHGQTKSALLGSQYKNSFGYLNLYTYKFIYIYFYQTDGWLARSEKWIRKIIHPGLLIHDIYVLLKAE